MNLDDELAKIKGMMVVPPILFKRAQPEPWIDNAEVNQAWVNAPNQGVYMVVNQPQNVQWHMPMAAPDAWWRVPEPFFHGPIKLKLAPSPHFSKPLPLP